MSCIRAPSLSGGPLKTGKGKEMNRRVLSMVLCVCLLGLTLPALSETSGEALMTMAGFDGANTYRVWADCLFFERMTELTGISFGFEQAGTLEEWETKKESMQPGSELPDVLFKANLTTSQMKRLYERGVLMDLAPLLESCCPNLSRILSEHPDYRQELSLPGGQIVSLPYIAMTPAQNAMWINRTWLNRLKLEAPEDLTSLEAVLTAFKTRDPNQNGRQDEVPLSFLGPFDLKFLAHAFGIVANDYNLFVDDAGMVRFAPLEEAYRPFVSWCADMYSSGLLDENGFYQNDTMRQVTSKDSAQLYGIILTTDLGSLFPAEWTRDYEMLMPLSHEGTRRYRDLTGHVFPGVFALTTACKDPETALRWVDTLYSVEGAKLMSIGKENVDYVVDGDGTWRVLQTVSENSSYISQALIMSGTTPPGISADEFELSFSDEYLTSLIKERSRLNEYCVRPFPHYDLTDAQKERVAALQAVLGYEVDMQIARWVLGEDQLTDESWDHFRSVLEEGGLQEFLSIWQEVYDATKAEDPT